MSSANPSALGNVAPTGQANAEGSAVAGPIGRRRSTVAQSALALAAPFLIAAAGGTLFFFIHTPLPWTLGAITASAIVAAMGKPWLMQAWARNTVRPILGVLAGSFFTAELVAMIGLWWPSILLAVANVLAALLLGYFFLVYIAGFDRTTAFFASAPGGIGELTMMGASMGGDVRRVVLVHLIRVIFVVFLVPIGLQIYLGRPVGRTAPPGAEAMMLAIPDWLVLASCAAIGFFVSRFVRFPGSSMICPMLFSMAVHVAGITDAAPPFWVVAATQIVLGGAIGARFAGTTWRELRDVISVAGAWTLLLLAFCVFSAWFGYLILGRPYESMLLALAPAGMAEMSIITYGLGLEVAFVVTCQFCRVTFVLLATPVVFRLLRIPARQADEP